MLGEGPNDPAPLGPVCGGRRLPGSHQTPQAPNSLQPAPLCTRARERIQHPLPGFGTFHTVPPPPPAQSGSFSSGPARKWLGLHDILPLSTFSKWLLHISFLSPPGRRSLFSSFVHTPPFECCPRALENLNLLTLMGLPPSF